MEESIEQNLETVSNLVDTLVQFAIEYGFQILGALIVLIIGLKIAGFAGKRVAGLCEKRGLDVTLSRFIGNVVKIILLAVVIIVTLGNFGITIAPFIALAGASAFGATLAIQGPLSNYGAGLSIILTRPFVVGNTIHVQGVSGVVEEITLAQTVLVGEDGEKISVPNKDVVGQVIVNSKERRVVQTKIALASEQDPSVVISLLQDVLDKEETLQGENRALVGIHDFSFGGVIIGIRYWVPSERYFAIRYAVNGSIMTALRDNQIKLAGTAAVSVGLESLSADDDVPGYREPIT